MDSSAQPASGTGVLTAPLEAQALGVSTACVSSPLWAPVLIRKLAVTVGPALWGC